MTPISATLKLLRLIRGSQGSHQESKGAYAPTMATIHVNTDVMRQLGHTFLNLNEEIQNQIVPQIKNGISQLDADWQGASRAHFESLFADWELHANQLVLLGEQIGHHLIRTSDAFDQADQT